MSAKKTKPARNAAPDKNSDELIFNKNLADQYENDYWRHSAAGGVEKREEKKKQKMKVSGKSVFKIKNILDKKSPPKPRRGN
jgi:hypothetical protein